MGVGGGVGGAEREVGVFFLVLGRPPRDKHFLGAARFGYGCCVKRGGVTDFFIVVSGGKVGCGCA